MKMAIGNLYCIEPECEEEVKLANAAILDYRYKKQQEEAIAENREALREMVISTIDAIGLEETKRIIREINRNLRGED